MKHAPTQASLDEVLRQCVRVQILLGAHDNSVLLRTDRTEDILALEKALKIIEDPASFDRCCCSGEERILLMTDHQILADIAMHHGVSIRWGQQWELDAQLVDGTLLLHWLSERGLEEPLARYNLQLQQEQEMIEEAKRWYRATPPPLREYAGAVANQELGQCVFVPTSHIGVAGTDREPPIVLEHHRELVEAFAEFEPNPVGRAQHLLFWLGFGSGLWSGYPNHETLTLSMLFTCSTEDVVKAASPEHEQPQVLTGALRFFGGSDFCGRRGGEIAELPRELRLRLLEEAERAEDENLRTHAQGVFADNPSQMRTIVIGS
jgi:hypothetical protein